MIGVAEYMRERAEDYGVNPDVAYTIGMLHDIGYINGRAGHEQYGASVLSAIGVDEDIRYAIAHHGENLRELHNTLAKEGVADEKITPEFVLLMEADMSVNARGYRVGFEGRLADIERRYGEDHIAVATVKDNISFIKEWQKEHGIGKPYDLYHKHRSEHKDSRKSERGE
jgi:putative nucleotidyltransferase with HDIG domain